MTQQLSVPMANVHAILEDDADIPLDRHTSTSVFDFVPTQGRIAQAIAQHRCDHYDPPGWVVLGWQDWSCWCWELGQCRRFIYAFEFHATPVLVDVTKERGITCIPVCTLGSVQRAVATLWMQQVGAQPQPQPQPQPGKQKAKPGRFVKRKKQT